MSDTRRPDLDHRSKLSFVGLDERLELVLEAGGMGTWMWDVPSGVVVWDPAMEARCGLDSGEFEGTFDAFLRLVHPEDVDAARAQIERTIATNDDLRYEHRVVWPNGEVHWLEGRGRVIRDDGGAPIAMIGVGIDIDRRKELDVLRDEAAALEQISRMARQLEDAERIAGLGSWYWDVQTDFVTCSAEMERMLEISGAIRGDEFREALLARAHPEDVGLFRITPEAVLAIREPFVTEQRLRIHGRERIVVHRGEVAKTADGETAGLRGTTQDVTASRRIRATLARVREVAARDRDAVTTLTEVLVRPEFPAVAGFEFDAQYLTPSDAPEIGGDWYDVFTIPGGQVVMSIGDVSGHGIRAARLMAKLRHSIRAYACLDPRPEVLLALLDGFLRNFGSDEEFATAQIALLDPGDATITVASAGHPPPLIVDSSGATFVPVRNAAPLRLLAEGTPPMPSSFPIAPGTTVFFYTDGLVERRGETLDAGFERLRAGLTNIERSEPRELSERAITTALAGTRAIDDICVLSVQRSDRGYST